jgi:hypothetical protein
VQSDGVVVPAPREGKAIYEAACMSCHGPDGRGLPQATVGFDLPLPDFSDCSFATREPDADWGSIVAHGGPVRAFDRRMPAFGDVLTPVQVASVLEYVRTFCGSASWPRGELNLPRPLRTEKAYPEDEAVMTVTFTGGDADSVESRFVYEHRLGPRNQWEVIVPLAAKDGGAGWQRGLGDVVFGFKRALYHSLERGSIFSAGGEVIFPTGKEDRGLGSGTTIFEPFVLYGQILPRDLFVQMHGAVELPADTARAGREALWRTAVGWTYAQHGGAGRAWSPIVELLAARELASGATTHWDVVPQMQVTLSRRQHIMASGGVQIPVNDRTGRSTRVMFYVLWDWFDGGLFAGWR